MAESKELKSLLIKLKEESENFGLKLNIQQTKIMASGPITSWKVDGETVTVFILGGSKINVREGNGNPLQYSCLANHMDGAARQAAVHGVAKSQTRQSDFTFTFHFNALEKEMATNSSVLAWRILVGRSLVGLHLWGHTESDMTEATQQQQQNQCRW